MSNVHFLNTASARTPAAVLSPHPPQRAIYEPSTPETVPVATLEALNLAAVIVDARLKVSWSSASARRDHRCFGSLEPRSHLRPGRPGMAEQLLRAVRSACGGEAGEVVLRTAHDDQPLLVRVLPLAGIEAALALLLIVDAGSSNVRDSRVVESRLSALFGLTPMEARVACGLADGDGMNRVATTLGIAVSTARTHAARCYEKTGVRRQAALARLANSLRQV